MPPSQEEIFPPSQGGKPAAFPGGKLAPCSPRRWPHFPPRPLPSSLRMPPIPSATLGAIAHASALWRVAAGRVVAAATNGVGTPQWRRASGRTRWGRNRYSTYHRHGRRQVRTLAYVEWLRRRPVGGGLTGLGQKWEGGGVGGGGRVGRLQQRQCQGRERCAHTAGTTEEKKKKKVCPAQCGRPPILYGTPSLVAPRSTAVTIIARGGRRAGGGRRGAGGGRAGTVAPRRTFGGLLGEGGQDGSARSSQIKGDRNAGSEICAPAPRVWGRPRGARARPTDRYPASPPPPLEWPVRHWVACRGLSCSIPSPVPALGGLLSLSACLPVVCPLAAAGVALQQRFLPRPGPPRPGLQGADTAARPFSARAPPPPPRDAQCAPALAPGCWSISSRLRWPP